ncbi:MAG: beta-ketoacyl-[acyl-carrier-protein] synthase family protein [Thermoguttaceae bacterium]|jgi:3-oxoacyl-[acyl-carrier-protein] synthase II
MTHKKEVVITGAGVVSPIGIGHEAFWASLCAGRSGVRKLSVIAHPELIPFGGEITDFDARDYVRQRKSLKVMSRDIQFGFAAADIACREARHHERPIDPERLGIVFGDDMIPCDLEELVPAYRCCITDGRFDFKRWGEAAMTEIFPLWMLKYLPNMPACHIGIAQDARGPNNTLTLGDVSGLSAAAEAVRVIERGAADAMIVGGAGSRIHPMMLYRCGLFELSRRSDDPPGASRPFDATRDGLVIGEGAGALMLEADKHARARGTAPLARVLGYCAAFEPAANGRVLKGTAIRQAISGTLRDSGIGPADVGCVVAHGVSTILDDQREAAAIREVLGDVAVTVPKSCFGHLGAGSGAVDLVAGVLVLKHRLVPPTLNYRVPDPHCPVRVIHGRPQTLERPGVMVLSHTQQGQAMAIALGPA